MTEDYLCPNCQTPWKCNGPHIPEPAPQPSAGPVAWMPIETAPEDGTAVLVMRDIWPGTESGHAEKCNGHNTYVAAWWAGENAGRGAWVCYMGSVCDPHCPIEPTHWMPLPKPPGETHPQPSAEPVACPSCQAAHAVLDADESKIIRNAKDGYPDGRAPRELTLVERVSALCIYAADWKRWCLEKETAYPQSDDTTPATDVALLRQSEREGWRYADELEQQRKADTALLRQALEALETGRDYAFETAEQFHIEMRGYKRQRHDAMDADVKRIDDTIAALRTSRRHPLSDFQKHPCKNSS